MTTKAEIEGIYRTVFGREADAGGLAFWEQYAKDNKGGANGIIDDMLGSAGGADQQQAFKFLKENPNYVTGITAKDAAWQYGLDPNTGDKLNPTKPSNTTTTPTTTQPAWVPKNESVSDKVNDLIAEDSPLMQRAATTGRQSANRRGLLNSSMAVQAAQAAVLDAATPIASQEAAQNAASNLSYQGFQQNSILQDKQLGSQQWIANLDATVRQNIANLQLGANDREKAAAMITSMQQLYSNVFQALSTNENIPADTRDTYMEHIAAMLQQNIRTVEQLYNINLNWTAPNLPSGNNQAA